MQRTLSDYSFFCRRLRYCTSTANAELCNNKRLTGAFIISYLSLLLILYIHVHVLEFIYIYVFNFCNYLQRISSKKRSNFNFYTYWQEIIRNKTLILKFQKKILIRIE